jgi:uncharacterized OB-fold protein
MRAVRCANCGGAVPAHSRFCPHCSAPQPEVEAAPEAELESSSEAAEAPPERARAKRGVRWPSLASPQIARAYAVLVFLAAAIVVFAVVAVALGWIGRDLLGT